MRAEQQQSAFQCVSLSLLCHDVQALWLWRVTKSESADCVEFYGWVIQNGFVLVSLENPRAWRTFQPQLTFKKKGQAGLQNKQTSCRLLWIQSYTSKKLPHANTQRSTCLGAGRWSKAGQGGVTCRTVSQTEHGWGLVAGSMQPVTHGDSRKTNVRPERKEGCSRKTIELLFSPLDTSPDRSV